MKKDIEDRIRHLKVRGYNKEEIYKILNKTYDVTKKDIDSVKSEEDIIKNSIEIYTHMQKDLNTLISKETDSSVILSAIKLQADLQKKKLMLSKNQRITKISKDFIYERDKEIYDMNQKVSIKEVARKFKISELSVKQAIDRYELGLSDELKTLSPTIISETKGLTKRVRLGILDSAYKNNLKRKDVREIVNKLKNEGR